MIDLPRRKLPAVVCSPSISGTIEYREGYLSKPRIREYVPCHAWKSRRDRPVLVVADEQGAHHCESVHVIAVAEKEVEQVQLSARVEQVEHFREQKRPHQMMIAHLHVIVQEKKRVDRRRRRTLHRVQLIEILRTLLPVVFKRSIDVARQVSYGRVAHFGRVRVDVPCVRDEHAEIVAALRIERRPDQRWHVEEDRLRDENQRDVLIEVDVVFAFRIGIFRQETIECHEVGVRNPADIVRVLDVRAREVCRTEAGDGLADVLLGGDQNGEDDQETDGVPARDAIVEVIVAGSVVSVMAHFSGSIEEERSRAARTTRPTVRNVNHSRRCFSLPQFA